MAARSQTDYIKRASGCQSGFHTGLPRQPSLYLEILKRADLVKYICPEYNKGCLYVKVESYTNELVQAIQGGKTAEFTIHSVSRAED